MQSTAADEGFEVEDDEDVDHPATARFELGGAARKSNAALLVKSTAAAADNINVEYGTNQIALHATAGTILPHPLQEVRIRREINWGLISQIVGICFKRELLG